MFCSNMSHGTSSCATYNQQTVAHEKESEVPVSELGVWSYNVTWTLISDSLLQPTASDVCMSHVTLSKIK